MPAAAVPTPRPRARRVLLAAALLLGGCAERADRPPELVVSAASSLGGVMVEAAERYREGSPGVVVRNNFGASGALEQQIRRGAEVDLFVSAGERELDALQADGLVRGEARRVLAGNRLVLVVPAGKPGRVRGFADLAAPEVQRVAIGDPAAVPAGTYARAALQRLGLWERLKGRLVLTTNVRQALTYVERGEVDAALVYRTDALASDRVRTLAVAPASLHPPIVYVAAVVAETRHPAEARRYLDFLAGPEVAAVLRRRGFLPPDSVGGA